jgi:hypothetical protein
MKFASFLRNGIPTYGIVSGDNVLDLKPILGERAPDLRSLISNDLAAAADALAKHGAPLKFADLELLPVIPNPDKIFA